MKRGLRRIVNSFGFDFIRLSQVEIQKRRAAIPFHYDIDTNLGYEYSLEAEQEIRKIRPYTMLPYINLVTLYEQVVYCERVRLVGDYVECGVWKGGSCALMALANMRHSDIRRRLHLFDIFDDICAPDPDNDGVDAIEEIKTLSRKENIFSSSRQPVKGVYSSFGGPGSVEETKAMFRNIVNYDPKYINYHVGWFEETIPQDNEEIEKIAILRLDGDLYSSIKTPLDYLYDKVVKGGIVIIDDYGYYEGCKKAVDEFRHENRINSYLNYSNATCRYWIKE